MSDEKVSPLPLPELLELLQRALKGEMKEPCPSERIEEVALACRKLHDWAFGSAHPDMVVQSLHVTVLSSREEGEGAPVLPIVRPSGEEVTPEDCIALGLIGAQWALGAQQMQKVKRLEAQKKAREQGNQRIWRPGMPH